MEERELRIEVGYGLEEVITDIEAGNIINNIIIPRFREENYEAGIYNGVIAISNEINSKYGNYLPDYSTDYTTDTKAGFSKTKAFENMITSIVIGVNAVSYTHLFQRICASCFWLLFLEEKEFLRLIRVLEQGVKLCV